MNISVELKQQQAGVNGTIQGEVDAFTAPLLREKLAEIDLSTTKAVNLDFSDVSYMDSTGLGVIVGFYKSITSAGGHLKLIGLSSRLRRLFDITGLGDLMDIESKREAEGNELR